MADFTDMSGNLPHIAAVDTSEDTVGLMQSRLQTLLGRHLAKGATIGRDDAAAVLAVALGLKRKHTEIRYQH